MKSLPDLSIDIPEWKDRHFFSLRMAEEKVSAIGKKAGKGSNEFKNACRCLLSAALGGNGSKIQQYIKNTIDVRAFTYLLSSSIKFSERINVSRRLIDHLLSIKSPVTRLTLTQLIRAFFVQFDEIADDEGLEDWVAFIKGSLSHYSARQGSSELKRYAQHADLLFSPDGPKQVVEFTRQRELDLDVALKRLSLDGFSDGRFITLCRYLYYLETLKELPVGQKHSVLAEVCKPDVVNSPYSDDKQLGHVILEILIDRSEGQALSQDWQSTILTIAGDPRVPKSSANYQQWWSLLGEKRIALMRGWLSRFDLKLFLKVLEQSAKDGSNSDMERMFESRKVFMEGLLNQGLVTESRLFLSGYAEIYLKRYFDKKELPDYARISSNQTSMIYLNLGGKVHMIEGSHSFKLKLFDRLPSSHRVSDYDVRVFGDRDLRTSIVDHYRREFGANDGFRELTHDIHLNWQNKAIEFLRQNGLKVEVAKMISKKHYRAYKQKFGVS